MPLTLCFLSGFLALFGSIASRKFHSFLAVPLHPDQGCQIFSSARRASLSVMLFTLYVSAFSLAVPVASAVLSVFPEKAYFHEDSSVLLTEKRSLSILHLRWFQL